MKTIFTTLIGLAILVGLVPGGVPNAYSVPISFNLEIANPAVTIFRLQNTSTGTSAQITDFSVTIGNLAYNFDLVSNQQILSNTGSMLMPSLLMGDTSQDGVRTDLLQYSFTGFDPTDRFAFNADIDKDNTNTSELFDQILFNNGAAGNAIVSVSFLDGLETGTLSLTLPDDLVQKTRYIYDVSGQTAPIPEPSTMLMLGSGFVGFWGFRRSFKK